MKNLKFLSLFVFTISLFMLQSCETDPCETVICQNEGICNDGTCDCPTGYSGTLCETHCSSSILGTWNVTNTAIFCAAESYTFTAGTTNEEIIIAFDWGNNNFTGTGTLSADCSTLSYTFTGSANSGTITFDGTTFTDAFVGVSSNCSFEAIKQ